MRRRRDRRHRGVLWNPPRLLRPVLRLPIKGLLVLSLLVLSLLGLLLLIIRLPVIRLPVVGCKGGGRLSLLVGHRQHLSLRLALCLVIDETPRNKAHPLSLLGACWEAEK